MPGIPDIFDTVADDGGGNWWDGLGDLAGKALDFLDDNEFMGDLITRLIAENPELDYGQIIDLAIQQTRLNAPNIYTPQGTTTTTFGEDGQPTITQTYTPEIQALYEMLVGNAGAPIDTYHAPRNFDPMMGKYINDREQHMGLPQTEYNPWRSSQGGGVNFPEIVPTLPPGTMTKTNNQGSLDTVFANQDEGPMVSNQMYDFLDSVARNNPNWQSPDFSWDDALAEYGGPMEGIDPGMIEQFLAEHGDQLAGFLGAVSGVPLAGTIAKYLGGKLIDNYWMDHQWQTPIEQTDYNQGDQLSDIDKWMGDNVATDMSTLRPQQSPNYQPATYRYGAPGSSWIMGSDGSVGYAKMPSSRLRNIGSVYDEPRMLQQRDK